MFFKDDREFFFSPLVGKRREIVVECISTIYDHLHGPDADYGQDLNRDDLASLISPRIQTLSNQEKIDTTVDEHDDLGKIDITDTRGLALGIIRKLITCGWIRRITDRATYKKIYQFTESGKTFAKTLWSSDTKNFRSRFRNVRNCVYSLEKAYKETDAVSLQNAFESSQDIHEDIDKTIEYCRDSRRSVIARASRVSDSGGESFSELLEFLNKFDKGFRKQITVDSVESNQGRIMDLIESLRFMDEGKRNRIESELVETNMDLNKDEKYESQFDYFLDRIEQNVIMACEKKVPELTREISNLLTTIAGINQKNNALQNSRERSHTKMIVLSSSLGQPGQDLLYKMLAQEIAIARVRLLDPISIKITDPSVKTRAQAFTSPAVISEESRLEQFMIDAQGAAFVLPADIILAEIKRILRERGVPQMRLSSLSIRDAKDVVIAMQAVETIRTVKNSGLFAHQQPNRWTNRFYSSSDYLIGMLP